MQFWRIGTSAQRRSQFRIEGMPLYVLATDGHPLSRPRKLTELSSARERVDAIAIGPQPGEYAMSTIPFQNEGWKKPEPIGRWRRSCPPERARRAHKRKRDPAPRLAARRGSTKCA